MDFCEKFASAIIGAVKNNLDSEKSCITDDENKEGYRNFHVRIFSDSDDLKAISNMAEFVKGNALEFTEVRLANTFCVIRIVYTYNIESGEPYCLISQEYSKKIGIYNDGHVISQVGNHKTCIVVHNDRSIYTKYRSGKYYPASIKNIGEFNPYIQKVIFKIFSEKSRLYKDFMKDGFYPTLKLEKLSEIFNKKDYFESEFQVSLPASVNKLSCSTIYGICCALRYINPSQSSLMFNKDYMIDFFPGIIGKQKKTIDKIAVEYITLIMCHHAKILTDDDILNIQCADENEGFRVSVMPEMYYTVKDYVELTLKLKEKVDIALRKKKIVKMHDECAIRLIKNNKNSSKKIKVDDTPKGRMLQELSLPDEFVKLDSSKALSIEGILQHNCVATYENKIKKGECVIYSVILRGEHITLEIGVNRRKYVIKQCLKSNNRSCSFENMEYIHMVIDKENKRLTKRKSA